jgi:uncharacterized membrane protein HdeD (DUF308 family)
MTVAAEFGSSMLRSVAQNWWLFLLRGVAAIIFGVLSLVWPGLSLLTLIILYGAYALADGIFSLGAGIFGRTVSGSRWWLIIVGLLGIAAGVITFMYPGLTALLLLFFIAAWAITIGVFEIIGAIQLRKEIDNEWWLILSGIVSIAFGCLMFAAPGAGALALVWIIAVYAIIMGVTMVGFAFNIRKYKTRAALA